MEVQQFVEARVITAFVEDEVAVMQVAIIHDGEIVAYAVVIGDVGDELDECLPH